MKIHFIGIGGIGVSALAQYYLAKGHQISGSDLAVSEITEFLQKKGVKIFIGNSVENIKKDFDLIVYSPAVKKDNPELLQTTNYKLKTMSYPEALGERTEEFYTIAISGSHGKSTTTAMTSLVLIEAGLDPTVIVGTKLKEFGNSNFRAGHSKYLVIEACEYDSSFLNYAPKIIVATNIDKEHLDYFKTFANVKKAFKDFIARLSADGFLVFNIDDKYPPKVRKNKFKSIGYSVKQKEAGKLKKILRVPGMHNVSNGFGGLKFSRILKIKDEITFKALSEFKGTWRRFEIKQGKVGEKDITVISDYAHHPNEIKATLNAAKEKFSENKIWCVFQPHQRQRTYYLFNDFVKTFRSAPINNIIITDIYDVAGRETKKISVKINW